MMNLLQNRHLGVRNEAIRDNEVIFVHAKAGLAGNKKRSSGAQRVISHFSATDPRVDGGLHLGTTRQEHPDILGSLSPNGFQLRRLVHTAHGGAKKSFRT